MSRWWLFVALAGCRINFDEIGGSGDDAATPDSGLPPNVPTFDANIAFLTSTTILPGTLGGLAQADAFCMDRARAANLPGTYVAWLSTSTTNAISRLGNARGWVRPDGAPFADTVGDIATGRLFYPLNVEETGAVRTTALFLATGSSPQGAHVTSCGDYTSTALSITTGVWWGTTAAWTAGGIAESCDSLLSIYCFGIDRQVAITIPSPPSPRRVAFASDTLWSSGGGIASADAVCQSDAEVVGLQGTFRAFLATTTTSAVARFDLAGAPWYRVDGIPLTNGTDLTSTLVPLVVTASGLHKAGEVHSGAGSPNAKATNRNCNDYTSTGAGQSMDTGAMEYLYRWFGYASAPCSRAARVYCFEI